MKKIFSIFGPTGIGKSSLSIKLAKRINGEIIGVDSRQIYDGISIGTAQPSKKQLNEIPHHLIGFKKLNETISSGEYLNLIDLKIEDIISRGKSPILCGGTGLYFKSLIEGIFEGSHTNIKIRKKLEAPDVLKLLEVVYEKWSPSMIGVESAGYQLALIQMLKRQTSLPITKLKADKDKLSRALPLSAKMESGLVYYSMDSLWYSDLEKEMLQFPAGEHDDQVDALAYGILQTSTRNKFKAY